MRCSRRSLFTCALAVAIALSPATTAAQKTHISVVSNVNLSKIRIGNFGQISPNYYRGAQPTGHDFTDLAALGVRTVIDLQQDGPTTEAGLVEATGMRFYRIPMTTHEPPTADELALFLKLVNDPVNQPVYVHCAGGRHRTGVMTAVYRMTHDAWTADQAFREMKQYKFGADFLHPEFKRFVYAYRAEPSRTAPAQTVAVVKATS